MKKFILGLLFYFLKFILSFRYKVKVEGLENLNAKTLNKKGGVLFLPNHPSIFVDPVVVTLAVWNKYPIRPMITDYMYYAPVVNSIARLLNALPVPNFHTSSNSLKRKKNDLVFQDVIDGLNNRKENFLVYPAGKTKSTNQEIIGGASGVHRIVQEAPDLNVVLVRTKGLWGSSFSRAFTGKAPPMFPTILQGVKHVFKNLLFFTPKREIIISFEVAPKDFPYKASRLEFNQYLENWYNKPDGLTKQEGKLPGDSLVLVPYSAWSKKLPSLETYVETPEDFVSLDQIPVDIQEKVKKKLAEMAEMNPDKIKAELSLSKDLGLDSLDMAEVVAYLADQFDVQNVQVPDLTSVNKVMAYAAKKIVNEKVVEEVKEVPKKWQISGKRHKVEMAPGVTVPEVFFNSCNKFKSIPAVGDDRSGVLSYSDMKMRVILLADLIKDMPGEYIGVLLPSSVVTTILILAVQLAGKVPLMINWTVGPRHLESVVALSKVQVVLSAWSFLDKLENVDLDGLEEKLIMLEDLKHQIGLKQKLKALYRSKLSTKSILNKFKFNNDPSRKAVLLFTSGTESMPKGVPLTHLNILSNQQGALGVIDLDSNDVFLAILPPFHSFGFTASSLLGVLFGFRTAFYPNPTDAAGLASAFQRWQATMICGAPTFIKAMLKAAKQEQVATLKLCVTGAEKAPPELFDLVAKMGTGHHLIEGYGITECSPFLSVNRLNVPSVGVGPAIDNVEMKIVHPESLEEVPNGQQGLIIVRGPNIFGGYLNPDAASPFVAVQGKVWYKTGDLGFLDENQNLTISGRMKRFVKIGGEMVSLTAVETALLQAAKEKHWGDASFEGPTVAISAIEKEGEKTKLFLFTIFNISLDEVNKTLKESGFSNLVKVSSVYKLDEIPIMGTGKINYRAIESEYLK